MSNVRWIGAAPLIAQQSLGTIGGTIVAGDTFSITIGNKTLTVAASSNTAAQTAVDIATAFQALSPTAYPEFAEISAQANSGTVTFLAQPAIIGKPFTMTFARVTAGSATWVLTTPVANSGPNDVACTANYSAGLLPVNGDTLVVDTAAPDMLWNLNALSGVTLALLSYTTPSTKCGLPEQDANGYPQYRPTFFQVSATAVNVNTKSSLMRFDFGTAQTTIIVQGTGTSSETGRNALCIRGSNASNSANIQKGDVALALKAGETAQFPDLRVSYVSNVSGDANVVCGTGCTLGAIIQSGGTLVTNSNITSIIQSNQSTWTHNAGTCAASDLRGGKSIYNSTGAITTPKIGGGFLDFSQSPLNKTMTGTCQGYGNGTFNDPGDTVNVGGSRVIQTNETTQFTINVGPTRTHTIT